MNTMICRLISLEIEDFIIHTLLEIKKCNIQSHLRIFAASFALSSSDLELTDACLSGFPYLPIRSAV